MLKSKLYLTLALVIVVSLVAGGSTLALFTAQTSDQQNTFTTGTLILDSERNDGDTVNGPMFYVNASQEGATQDGTPGQYPTDLWAPGDWHQRTLTVYNRGSLDGWLDYVQANLHQGGNSYTAMADELYVEIYTPYNGLDTKVTEGYLSTFLAGPVQLRYPGNNTHPVVFHGSNRHMNFKVRFDNDAGNALQGKNLVVDFIVHGVQKPNNPNP